MKVPNPFFPRAALWLALLFLGVGLVPSQENNSSLVGPTIRAKLSPVWSLNFSRTATTRDVCLGCAPLGSFSSPGQARMIYPWKKDIMATVFWVGEKPTPRNPTSNQASSWDPNWTRNYGGYDDPENRVGWLPRGFVPGLNPFYIALPYNDTARQKTKPTARPSIPWFESSFYRDGKSVLKGRWVAIRQNGKTCYAQWEDCGPFHTDDWEYVFGDKKPLNLENGGAGLDVSPAVRDFLGFKWQGRCDWRFVELHEVTDGPWKRWGKNNPFALRQDAKAGSGKGGDKVK